MDKAAALVALSNMTAADQRPALSTGDLNSLLTMFQVPDHDGRLVTDAGWVESWDLNLAAAEGWRWKAAKVAGDFTFSADDASFNKGDVIAQCLKMAAEYAAKAPMHLVGMRDDRTHSPYDAGRLIL